MSAMVRISRHLCDMLLLRNDPRLGAMLTRSPSMPNFERHGGLSMLALRVSMAPNCGMAKHSASPLEASAAG